MESSEPLLSSTVWRNLIVFDKSLRLPTVLKTKMPTQSERLYFSDFPTYPEVFSRNFIRADVHEISPQLRKYFKHFDYDQISEKYYQLFTQDQSLCISDEFLKNNIIFMIDLNDALNLKNQCSILPNLEKIFIENNHIGILNDAFCEQIYNLKCLYNGSSEENIEILINEGNYSLKLNNFGCTIIEQPSEPIGYKINFSVSYSVKLHECDRAGLVFQNSLDTYKAVKVFEAHQFPILYLIPDRYIWFTSLPNQIWASLEYVWYITKILNANQIPFTRSVVIDDQDQSVESPTPFCDLHQPLKFLKSLVSPVIRNVLDTNPLLSENFPDSSFIVEIKQCSGQMNGNAIIGQRCYQFTFPNNSNVIAFETAKSLLEKRDDPYLYRYHEKQEFLGKLLPFASRSFTIHKDMRNLFDKAIQLYDEKIRNITKEMIGKAHSTAIYSPSCNVYYARVFQNCKEDDNIELGIEGWPLYFVKEAFEELTKLLEPTIIDCKSTECEKVLYGIGEAHAKTFIDDHRPKLIVDFDRFGKRLIVYGMDITKFQSFLSKYDTKKHNLVVTTYIDLSTYFLNDWLEVNYSNLRHFAEETGANIQRNGNKSIFFRGTSKAYDCLKQILNRTQKTQISEKLKKRIMFDDKCVKCNNSTEDFEKLNCGHIYCPTCIHELLSHVTNNINLVHYCLKPHCDKVIKTMDIERIICGGKDRYKFLDNFKMAKYLKSIKDRALLSKHTKFRMCSSPECEELFVPSNGSELCNKCLFNFCPDCFEPHHRPPCASDQLIRAKRGNRPTTL